MVFSGGATASLSGGLGISAVSPFEGCGSTMKMMSSTSNTSISGVTLISDEATPRPPSVIAMCLLLTRAIAIDTRRPGNVPDLQQGGNSQKTLPLMTQMQLIFTDQPEIEICS